MHYWVATDTSRVDWNRVALAASAFSLAAGIYDAHTTVSVLAAGGVEKNPLYGSHPSAGRLYGTNIAACAVPLLLSQWRRHRHPESADALNRGVFLAALAGGGVHLGAGLHNGGVLREQEQLRIR